MDAVVAVTVMSVLFFLHASMLRECEGAWVTAILVWGMDELWLWCRACLSYMGFRYCV